MKDIAIKIASDKLLKMAYREDTSDRSVIEQIWSGRAYDLSRLRRVQELQEIYKRIVYRGKNPLVIDAGANIGASSLYFSESYKHSQVVAIEPESRNFEMLMMNTKQCSNVLCMRSALSCSDGELNVVDPGEGEWGFRAVLGDGLPEEKVIETVTSVSVKKILEKFSEYCLPFIIKIDIEGGENELFSDNVEWIDEFPIMIIELHDWLFPSQANSLNFLKSIANRDRDFVFIGENVFSIKNY